MPEAPMPATLLSPRLKAQKLRCSCDGCGSAKVKCDRGRPKCGRCETISLTCVYGPSRKTGKPPRKSLKSARDATIENRTCMSWTATHSSDIHTAVEIGGPQNANESAQSDLSDPVTATLPFSSGINTASGIGDQNQVASEFYPLFPLDEWSQLGEWDQFDSFGGGPDFSSASPLEPVRTVSKNPNEPHSCARDSYEIFRDLICPTPSLHAPESNSVTVSAKLDQVLQFSKNAIDRLTQVLRCPCATSGHRAMVHASIVSRILIWYQQAAGWNSSSSWGPRPSALADSLTSRPVSSSSRQPPSSMTADTSTENPYSLVQATGFSVEQVPLSIGPSVSKIKRSKLCSGTSWSCASSRGQQI